MRTMDSSPLIKRNNLKIEIHNIIKYLALLIINIFVIAGDLKAKQKDEQYQKIYDSIYYILTNYSQPNFKETVFIVENAYYDNQLDINTFNQAIRFYTSLCNEAMQAGGIIYTEKDQEIAKAQCAVFVFMTDSLSIDINGQLYKTIPFTYNHTDFLGQQDWSNMFVTTLMQTHKGNCHSMPYLYKIIMDELGYECHLALAPNHIYIKANNKKVGWYNIELTCGDFPTDAWYAASGYIHTDAIRNGIYMRALSDKEAVAMTLVDLAQGYQAKFGIEDGSFIIQCCDTALKHFPNYINALLLKSEILTEIYKQSNDAKQFAQLQELVTTIHNLGYRKMPPQMYANWMKSLNTQESNQQIKAILNPRTK